ncbi:tail fiber domain-containing protein [Erwinia phyllosphaerae]|uniref:tail fiber domain-containing protein n=1 Tax=Erwinia phyllosphaerae TaxID=2853256 RepID=UPI001FEFD7EB|nr:tail fiber domain-containing protein [Erwinia phyllosphaerae]MBV4366307.1 tail fiber domain-containing protein [Erwinia phyllosphaerae]
MAAGKIIFINNSTAVTGTETGFKSDLTANDFIVTVIGGVTYTLGVKSVESDTALTLNTAFSGPTTSGVAWSAVANQALVGITAQLAADVAKAIRGLNLDKANWQGFYTATGDITINLPDGAQITGPSWPAMQKTLNGGISGRAASGVNSDITELTGLKTALSVEQGGTGATTEEDARTNLGLKEAAVLDVGTTADTVAAGNDARFNTVNGKSGGKLGGSLGVGGAGDTDLRQQGAYLSWNESAGTGAGSIVVNPGGGTGGFWIRLINNTNTAETMRYTFEPNGIFRAPNGSTSVSNRVRAFTAIASNYLEVVVDDNAKGINFFDSDENLKENIQDVDPEKAIDIIRLIRPVSFKFIDTENIIGSTHEFGVIAQELEKILPSGVITLSNKSKTLNPGELIGLLLTAVKGLILRVEKLEVQ